MLLSDLGSDYYGTLILNYEDATSSSSAPPYHHLHVVRMLTLLTKLYLTVPAKRYYSTLSNEYAIDVSSSPGPLYS